MGSDQRALVLVIGASLLLIPEIVLAGVEWQVVRKRRQVAPLAILLGSFNSAYLPHFYEQRRSGHADLRKLAKMDTVIVAALALIVTGTMMIGPELVRILAPPSYGAGTALVPPLVLTAFLGGAALQFNKEILFHKRPGIVSTVMTLPALVAVGANIVLIPTLGIAAAAWAGAAASALTLSEA